MQILDKKIKEINEDKELSLKFISSKHNNLNINCNILNDNFYLDSHHYFPITNNYFSFLEIFGWGDALKYQNFYSKDFADNFKEKSGDFKTLSNIYVLGSSSVDNYYRNIITFLPRIFFNNEKKIKLAIHRNSANKFRDFILYLCNKMNIEVQFIFLDDGFYKFINSKIPQFINKEYSLKILNSLKTSKAKKNKIYLTRQNSTFRNLINEADVIEKLKKFGFEAIDLNELKIIDQIQLFSNADYIISPSGSALTNIVFCNPETKIIEISPIYNFEYEKNLKTRFQDICKILNLNYLRIDADSIDIAKIDNNKLDNSKIKIISS
ncbi:glycosyltransferase family 61 protein, partial [Alphaproteobacteria bacterium]|nr:glycosyltransferase family 61 protein [Alphaproteobacteria bacterium]